MWVHTNNACTCTSFYIVYGSQFTTPIFIQDLLYYAYFVTNLLCVLTVIK